jgi:hypothetical protein
MNFYCESLATLWHTALRATSGAEPRIAPARARHDVVRRCDRRPGSERKPRYCPVGAATACCQR